MKELEKVFSRKNKTYTQLFFNDKGYLYMVSDNDGDTYYEVFEKKIVDRIDFITKTLTGEQKVKYPKDNDFGKWAWCVRDLDRAKTKLSLLI